MIYRDAKGRFCKKEHAVITVVKGYKGFKPGLRCLGKKYAENTVFIEDEAIPCERGMHFCKNPLAVLDFYKFINEHHDQNEFAEVEAYGDIKTDDNVKFCTTKLKVLKKLSFEEFINAALAFNEEHSHSKEEVDTYNSIATSKKYNSFVLNRGNYSCSVASGDFSIVNAVGQSSASITNGSRSIANSKRECSISCVTGVDSLANSDGWGSISSTTSYCSIANSNGVHGIASSTGVSSLTICNGPNSIACINSCNGMAYATRKQSVAIATGHNGKVKGALGCWIACAEHDSKGDIIDMQMRYVDGKDIKANTWYRLKNGKFVEVN